MIVPQIELVSLGHLSDYCPLLEELSEKVSISGVIRGSAKNEVDPPGEEVHLAHVVNIEVGEDEDSHTVHPKNGEALSQFSLVITRVNEDIPVRGIYDHRVSLADITLRDLPVGGFVQGSDQPRNVELDCDD